MGLADAHLDEYGYVYATIPANIDKKVPVICFCSHMDTSPDCTGKNVKPQIVKNYRGGDIVLPARSDPGDPRRRTSRAEQPDRQRHHHHRRHHAARCRQQGRRRRDHGCRAFPDPESASEARHHQDPVHARRGDRPRRRQGRPEKARRRFRLHHGWRDRGPYRGRDLLRRRRHHHHRGRQRPIPGFAKGKMEHAIKIAAAIVDRLPKKTCSPETTEGKEGFLHPVGISGALEQTTIGFIVRDFNDEGLKEKEALLESIVKDVMKDYPRSTYRMDIKEQYRNMKQVIDRTPANRRLCDRSDPPRWARAGAKLDPRRHRRLAAVIHGTALPQHLRRRARLPLPPGMGEPAGHGKSSADHRASRDDLGGAGLNLPRRERPSVQTYRPPVQAVP